MDAYTKRPRRPFYLDTAARDYAIAEVKKKSRSGREIDPTMFGRVLAALERNLLLGKTHQQALDDAAAEEKLHPGWKGLYKMAIGFYRAYRRKCRARGNRSPGTVPTVPADEVITRIDPNGQRNLF